MADFFIRRPIVAIVISIMTVLLGLNSLRGLSFEQYPFLAPPTIRVTANYPGASAVAVEQSVATPIEQEVNGVEGMIYMKSSNTSDGRMQLDVNFQVGTDQDMANVLTQNRVSSAQARLPQEVVQQGVTVKKQSPSILMIISLYSPKGSYDANFLDQLLRHQPARPAPAHPRHRPGRPLRGHRLRDAHLAAAGQAGQARADARGRDRRDQGAEPPGPGRPRGHAALAARTRSSPTR